MLYIKDIIINSEKYMCKMGNHLLRCNIYLLKFELIL